MPGPLAGLRVLDLSRVLAGPWATQILADFGAQVIKVEKPGEGDDTRGWGPPFITNPDGSKGDAAYFLSTNRGKWSVEIDMASVEGQKLIRELAAKSDIVMENFKVGGLKKYGLDYIAQRDRELQAADPIGYALRKKMGEDITGEGFGTNLSAAQQQQVTQSERAAQAARGNIFGAAPAAAEAMSVGDAGFRMRQQRLANASAFLAGTTPIAQFGQISGAQQGASQFNPQGIQGGTGLNPNAGQMGTNFALSNWQNKFASFQDARANDPMNMIGGALMGAGTKMFTGGLTSFAGSFGQKKPTAAPYSYEG